MPRRLSKPAKSPNSEYSLGGELPNMANASRAVERGVSSGCEASGSQLWPLGEGRQDSLRGLVVVYLHICMGMTKYSVRQHIRMRTAGRLVQQHKYYVTYRLQ